MAGRRRITRQAVLAEARGLVRGGGWGALTFQAIADRLGVTKQAVIYWFPTKRELAAELSRTEVAAEAQVTIEAIGGAISGADAIARFVRAMVAHHLGDLQAFRLLYCASQVDREMARLITSEQDLTPIHRETSAMYSALAAGIATDTELAGAPARRAAVAVHMAALGLLTMVSLAETTGDPLAHDTEALVTSLIELLTGRWAAAGVGDQTEMTSG